MFYLSDINDIEDLSIGMKLEGTVTNVANFGAFVDVGVHCDGLIHISQMANAFVTFLLSPEGKTILKKYGYSVSD